MTIHTSTMQTGVLVKAHMGRCVLFLFLMVHLCLAAPGFPGTQGDSSAPALVNPFSSGDEDRSLLKSFIQSILTIGEGGPEIITWEQEVFSLFGLFDYDHSGFLDGLELMRLVSEYNRHLSPGEQATEQVVALVDFLLQTQDLNQDGLLTPLELLSPPLSLTQDSINKETTDTETTEHTEDDQKELQPQNEEHPQQELRLEEEIIVQVDEQHRQQIQEAQAVEMDQVHQVPVHLGQPEI